MHDKFEIHYDGKKVAEGCRFTDGFCSVRWRGNGSTPGTSQIFGTQLVMEDSLKESDMRLVFTGDAFKRGWRNAQQDRCEGVLFKVVDGKPDWTMYHWVLPEERYDFFLGYEAGFRDVWDVEQPPWRRPYRVGKSCGRCRDEKCMKAHLMGLMDYQKEAGVTMVGGVLSSGFGWFLDKIELPPPGGH